MLMCLLTHLSIGSKPLQLNFQTQTITTAIPEKYSLSLSSYLIVNTTTTEQQTITMASNTTASGTKKSKKFFGAFRKNKSKKVKKTSAAAIAMENKSPQEKKQFLVEDSNSSTTEDVNLLELDSDVEYSLDLVVLLMHPVSHRFELLQLEFDEASKAKISDLLAQIPLSVTESCLKDQLYDGILNQDSADPSAPLLLKSTKLIDAFGRKLSKPEDSAKPAIKMVLVARPQGLSNEDALKMAKPIFSNKDISSMVIHTNRSPQA